MTFPRLRAITLGALLAMPAGPALAGVVEEPLVLRVSDAIGRPGGLATLVVRTYSPRAVGQGQLDLRASGPARRGTDEGPIVAVERVQVFASAADAEWSVHLAMSSEIALQILSPSGTINDIDGPLLAVQVRLSEELTPGDVLHVSLDPNAFVEDPSGGTIDVELRGGELEIVDHDAPFSLEVDGDQAAPGGTLASGVETLEPLPLSSTAFGLRIDPRLFESGPVFVFDPRYGQADLTVDHPEADLWVVRLESADGSLNEFVVGGILSLRGIASRDLVPGGTVPIVLDPTHTEIRDSSGAIRALELNDGVIEIVAAEPTFADGFESGTTSSWSVSNPR